MTNRAPSATLPTNLDETKAEVMRYYGDYLDEGGRHRFSSDSQWMLDVRSVAAAADQRLLGGKEHDPAESAVVFDVDDTILTTYEYLANTSFGSRQNRDKLPGIQPIVELADRLAAAGYKIFLITERLEERRKDTLANLSDVGFPTPADALMRVRQGPYPQFLADHPHASTIEFKSAARAYLEQQTGLRVAGSIGDQLSDLAGPSAGLTFQVPNPLYDIP